MEIILVANNLYNQRSYGISIQHSEINLQPQRQNPVESMINFVRSHGGMVRYDDYSREHLAGSVNGFYTQKVDLSDNHIPVATPMNHSAGYCRAYALLILLELRELCLRNDSHSVQICEVGPGGGELRREIVKQFEINQDFLWPLEECRYIAIDPNLRHVNAIKAQGRWYTRMSKCTSCTMSTS